MPNIEIVVERTEWEFLDKKTAMKIMREMRTELEHDLKMRLVRGVGQPPYSTKGTWYPMNRPRGHKNKFVKILREQGYSIRKASRQIKVFLEKGYAQFRGIIRGHGPKSSPVTYELTGDLVKQLRMRGRVNMNKLEMSFWIGFKNQKRRYGNLTNTRLAAILNRRAPQHPAFDFEEQMVHKIFERAFNKHYRQERG